MSQQMKVKFTDDVLTLAHPVVHSIDEAAENAVQKTYEVSTTEAFGRAAGGSVPGHNGVTVIVSDENGLQYTEDGGATVKQSNIVASDFEYVLRIRNVLYSERLSMWIAGDVDTGAGTLTEDFKHKGNLWYSTTGKTWHKAKSSYNPVYVTGIAENDGVVVLPSNYSKQIVVGDKTMYVIGVYSEDGIEWHDILADSSMVYAEAAFPGSETVYSTVSTSVASAGAGNGFFLADPFKGYAWKIKFVRGNDLKLSYGVTLLSKDKSVPGGEGDCVWSSAFSVGDDLFYGYGSGIVKLDKTAGTYSQVIAMSSIPRGAVVVDGVPYVCTYDGKVYKIVIATSAGSTTYSAELVVNLNGAGTEKSPFYGKKPECITYDGTDLICFGYRSQTEENPGAIFRIKPDTGVVTLSTATHMSVVKTSSLDPSDVTALTNLKAAISGTDAGSTFEEFLTKLRGASQS